MRIRIAGTSSFLNVDHLHVGAEWVYVSNNGNSYMFSTDSSVVWRLNVGGRTQSMSIQSSVDIEAITTSICIALAAPPHELDVVAELLGRLYFYVPGSRVTNLFGRRAMSHFSRNGRPPSGGRARYPSQRLGSEMSSPIQRVADYNVTATEYMIDDGNESEITMDGIMKALTRMKVGKAAGYDKSFVRDAEWRWVIVPFFKRKGSRQFCTNYRPISLLSVVGKLYATIIIERVLNETENKIWDVQMACLYDLKENECGLRIDKLFVKCLLYADDQVILALLAGCRWSFSRDQRACELAESRRSSPPTDTRNSIGIANALLTLFGSSRIKDRRGVE
ncbi:hypothetical protein EVAR_23571_1 [Eumeta japonica]|uniref:Reverse transcriptase domain-containing protein n=1 Tax=Eumeta variegata TaxID=151549 RepID=A0A4C1X0A0_EUMVA|nr:hypothetical protein EVAR_23571_1 [Eumeta japonica]